MIVNPQFKFRADVLLPRARKTRHAFAASTPSILIREATDAQAPVVLRNLALAHQPVDVRFFDGLLYEAHPMLRKQEFSSEKLASHLIKLFLNNTHLDGSSEDATVGARDRRLLEGTNVVSHEDLVVGVVQSWVDEQFVVIDGVLHSRTHSPALTIEKIELMSGIRGASDLFGPGLVPVWMPDRNAKLRSLFESLEPRDREVALVFLSRRAVEFVRPDLLPTDIAEWGGLCDIDWHMRWLVKEYWEDPRFHLAIPAKAKIDHVRRKFLESVAECINSDAAHLGPDTLLDRLAASLRPLDGSGAEPSEVFDASSSKWPRVDGRIAYAKGIYKHWSKTVDHVGGEGWTLPGMEFGEVDVRVPIFERSSISPVASIPKMEIVHGPFGYMIRVPGCAPWHQPGVRSDARPNARIENLIETAWKLGSGAEGMKKDGVDYLGRSMRRGQVLPRLDDGTRASTLREFAYHRMVVSGGEIFLRCPEPLIVLQPASKKQSSPGIGISVSYALLAAPTKTPPYLFRMDREAEAMSLAEACGLRKEDAPNDRSRVELVDASLLSYDTALWNLRSSLIRIVPAVDCRMRFLPPGSGEAIGRLVMHLETWAVDPRLVDTDQHMPTFLSDAEMFVSVLDDPMLDGVGDAVAREMARNSMIEVLAMRKVAEPDEEFDYVLGM